MSANRELSRRSFLRRALAGSIGLLSLEGIGASIAILWPNVRDGLGAAIEVGTLEEIAGRDPGFAQGLPHRVDAASCFLVDAPAAMARARGSTTPARRPEAGDLIALWRRCPHLGCQIPPVCTDRHRFECRCHGSTFNIIGEKLTRGPAPRGLDRFAVRLSPRGRVVVDTSQVIAGAPAGAVSFRDPHPADEGCRPGG